MSRIRISLRFALPFVLIASCLLFFTFPHLSVSKAATVKYNVLFDNAHAETAGNADWIISTSQPDPLAQNANPQTETAWTGGISAWGVALQKPDVTA